MSGGPTTILNTHKCIILDFLIPASVLGELLLSLTNKSQQLAEDLRRAIQSGKWAPGERLPGEYELQAAYNVSRTTIRDALSSLAASGMVIRKHGIGTFVAEKPAGKVIALAVDAYRLSLSGSYWFPTIVENAQNVIAEAGHRAVLVVGHGKSEEEFMSSIHMPGADANCEICGVIDMSSRKSMTNYFESLGVPVVQIECAVPTSTYSITLDYAKFTELGVQTMLHHRWYITG